MGLLVAVAVKFKSKIEQVVRSGSFSGSSCPRIQSPRLASHNLGSKVTHVLMVRAAIVGNEISRERRTHLPDYTLRCR